MEKGGGEEETKVDEMRKSETNHETRIDCLPDIPAEQSHKLQPESKKEKTKLLTPQFFLWYIIVGGWYFYFFYLCYKRSSEWTKRLRYVLSQGIIPGRLVDAKDPQWRQLRELFPPLFVAGFLWVALSNAVRKLFGPRSIARKVFYILSIVVVLYGLHSRALVFPIFVGVVHYFLARIFRASKIGIAVAWLWNIGITLYMYDTSGFRTVGILGFFFEEGQMLRWHTIFKISLLRMISFHMDYYWALKKRPPNQRVSAHSELERLQEENRPIEDYNFVNFFIYVFHPIFYISGPIVTFNSFIAQYYTPQKTLSIKKTLLKLAQVGFYIIAFDISNHYLYTYAINEVRMWTSGMSPLELFSMLIHVMNWMWMKFLIIWRFFRLFGVLDGINSHENMPHCISMVLCPSFLWKFWHASFNKWTVRYLYVPLGGRKYQWLSAWLIFVYIGLWHDLEWKWFWWGIANCLGVFIEYGVRTYYAKPCWDGFKKKWYCRHVESFVGAISVWYLVVFNMFLFHGFEKTWFMIKLFFSQGVLPIIGIFSFFFALEEIAIEVVKYQNSKRKLQKMI